MDYELKTFTVEEVNKLIPALSRSLKQLKSKQVQLFELEAQIDALELVSEHADLKSVKELNRLLETHHTRMNEFYKMVDTIHQYGCFLKDVELGLVDFYSVIDGKVVYLCWKLGEESVSCWHEVGKGYLFRKPLSESPRAESEDSELQGE